MGTRHHLTHRQQLGGLLAVFVLLGSLGAAWFTYTGPHRTVTTYTTTCRVILWRCQDIGDNVYRWRQAEAWACSAESKPWEDHDNYRGPCSSGTSGRTKWDKDESVVPHTTTYPPATVSGSLLCDQQGNGGWCLSGAAVSLAGSEPVAGYEIFAVEGVRGSETFVCDGSSCNVPLVDGDNTINFWAASTFGDTSLMGSLTGKIDANPPLISSSLTGSLGSNSWYVSPVTASATAVDAASGVASLSCGLDGVAQPSCMSINVNGEGAHTFLMQAADVAGNSGQDTREIRIDTQPPSITAGISGERGNNNWYTSAALIASATDPEPGSGVGAFQYSLGGGAWTAFPGTYTLPDGSYTLDVRALDNAGNVAQAAQTSVQIDATPPEIALSVTGTGGNSSWYISPAALSASASDSTSGMNVLEYSLDNAPWKAYTSALVLNDGVHSVRFYAEDRAGGSTQVDRTVKVDTQPPLIGGSLSGTLGTNGWYISNTTLSAYASDAGSGVASFIYELDGGTAAAYGTPLVLSDGLHAAVFSAEDQAGLRATFTQSLKVDTHPPALQVASVLPEWIEDSVVLNGTASDELSGLARVEISLNNGTNWISTAGMTDWSYTWNTTAVSDGVRTVRVRAVDAAGLSTGSAFIAQVDNHAPIIRLPDEWDIWETVKLDADDDGAGLSELKLTIGDPADRWPERKLSFAPGHLPMDLKWDRRFQDDTLAPSGDYDVWVTARDHVGRISHKAATIHIPWVSALLPAPATATPLPTLNATATRTPAILSGEFTPTPSGDSAALVFGAAEQIASPLGTAQMTPSPTAEPVLRPTPTRQSFTGWLASIFAPQPTPEPSTTEIGPDPLIPVTGGSSNVDWGVEAAAGVASMMAYYVQKRKEEEEEQKARAEAEAAAANAAWKARMNDEGVRLQNWLEGQATLNAALAEARAHGAGDKEIADLRKNANTVGLDAALPTLNAANQAASLAEQAAARRELEQQAEARAERRDDILAWNETQREEAEELASGKGPGLAALMPKPLDPPTLNEMDKPPKWSPFETALGNFWTGASSFFGGYPHLTAPPTPEPNPVSTQVSRLWTQLTQTAQASITPTPTALVSPTSTATLTRVTSPTPTVQTMWVTYPANLRADPSVNNPALATLSYYTQVLLTGESSSGHDQYGHAVTFEKVLVTSSGQSGWVASNFLDPNVQNNPLRVDLARKVNIPNQYPAGGGAQYLRIYPHIDTPTDRMSIDPQVDGSSPFAHYNLCGEFSAAYIAGQSIDELINDWANQDAGYLQSRAREALGRDKEKQRTGISDIKNMLDQYSCSYKDIQELLTDEVVGGTIINPNRLKTHIDQGYALIVGVNINSNGTLNQGGSISHWVVVDDVAPQGVNDGEVLIYNPMVNGQQIYQYPTFIQAAGNFDGAMSGVHPSEFNLSGLWVDPASCKP